MIVECDDVRFHFPGVPLALPAPDGVVVPQEMTRVFLLAPDIGNYTTENDTTKPRVRILRERNPLMHRLALSSICLLALAFTGSAVAGSYRWTPAKAQIRVKAVYRTPDTTPHANPPPDAVVDTARCAGVGKPVNHRYSRFHCTVVMRGWGDYAGDGFHAVQKLTVTSTGALTFTWTMGWR